MPKISRSRASEVIKSAHYLEWSEKLNDFDYGKMPTTNLWIVGIDKFMAGDIKEVRSYSGEALLIRIEDDGTHVVEYGPFPWSTHPGQLTTNASGTPDVNKDGKKDIGWTIEHNVYPLQTRPTTNGRYNPTVKWQPVLRDTLHKGDIAAMPQKLMQADYVQLHVGGSKRPSSVGCWTVPPLEYAKLQKAIADVRKRYNTQTMNLIFTYDE